MQIKSAYKLYTLIDFVARRPVLHVAFTHTKARTYCTITGRYEAKSFIGHGWRSGQGGYREKLAFYIACKSCENLALLMPSNDHPLDALERLALALGIHNHYIDRWET